MMNGLGNENSGSKIKTLESLEKFDPLNSINSQFQNIISSKIIKKTEREDGKENKDEIFKIEEENIKTNDYAKSENSDFIQKEKDEDEKTDEGIKQIKNELKGMEICSDGNKNEYSVKYYECFQTKEEFIIIMELCDDNLENILKKEEKVLI